MRFPVSRTARGTAPPDTPERPTGDTPERPLGVIERPTGRLRSCRFTPEGTMDQTLELTDSETVEADEVIEEELLVEEISIDGMCGVY